MASIQRRPDGQWRARYRDEQYREHTRHFARRVDAQQRLDSITASVVRGDYVDPKAGAVTLAEYAGRWQASHVSRDNTARIADNALLRQAADRGGGVQTLQRGCPNLELVRSLS